MREAAEHYFADGSIEQAVPPLQALLHVMRDGTWEGRGPDAPKFRALFARESVMTSDWYRTRLEAQRTVDRYLLEKQTRYLEKFLTLAGYTDVAKRLDVNGRLDRIAAAAKDARTPAYLQRLSGTLGVEPSIAAELSRLPPV